MGVSEQILNELKRYNSINNYIFEQELTPPADDPTALPPADATTPPVDDAAALPTPDAATPPTDTTTPPEVVDIENDPDVEKVGDEKTEDGSEELEITDLITAQKNIETKQEDYFNNLFNQLNNLESKLQDMNSVIEKLNSIESKIEKYREKTPQEKLELRSLDSGPYNQKLSDFFADKEEDLEKSGKNEYILTTDEVENYSPSEIKNSFNDYGEEEDFKEIKY
jgi:hypothetical protein